MTGGSSRFISPAAMVMSIFPILLIENTFVHVLRLSYKTLLCQISEKLSFIEPFYAVFFRSAMQSNQFCQQYLECASERCALRVFYQFSFVTIVSVCLYASFKAFRGNFGKSDNVVFIFILFVVPILSINMIDFNTYYSKAVFYAGIKTNYIDKQGYYLLKQGFYLFAMEYLLATACAGIAERCRKWVDTSP